MVDSCTRRACLPGSSASSVSRSLYSACLRSLHRSEQALDPRVFVAWCSRRHERFCLMFAHHRHEGVAGHRGTEVEALILIAAEPLQEFELIGRLYAFRDHLQAQGMSERDDG